MLDQFESTMGRLGRPDWVDREARLNTSATTHVLSPIVRQRRLQALMGDCKPLGDSEAGEELPGTAGRRPNRDCGPLGGARR